jgi:L-ascorbate metabolism protein UlaG (beta-lactamase superfamily)
MFAPIRGGSTMDDQEAAQVVNRIKPKVVAPIQYDVPDRAERLDRFMALSEAKVVLPKKSE